MEKIKRWVILPVEVDKQLKEEAKKQDRSAANMLSHIIKQYFITK